MLFRVSTEYCSNIETYQLYIIRISLEYSVCLLNYSQKKVLILFKYMYNKK